MTPPSLTPPLRQFAGRRVASDRCQAMGFQLKLSCYPIIGHCENLREGGSMRLYIFMAPKILLPDFLKPKISNFLLRKMFSLIFENLTFFINLSNPKLPYFYSQNRNCTPKKYNEILEKTISSHSCGHEAFFFYHQLLVGKTTSIQTQGVEQTLKITKTISYR